MDDLNKIVFDYKQNIDNINDKIKNECYLTEIINDIILIYSEIKDTSNSTSKNTKIIKRLLLQQDIINPEYSDEYIQELKNKIINLRKIKQPEQRSKEWHEFRNNRLTASDLATALKKNKYSSRNILVAKKCGYTVPFLSGSAILHGVKYEDVAVKIYEDRNDVIIDEYGCIPHPEIDYFAASPDGICSYESNNTNYIGRMLEIKCPKSREITGVVPEHYELQVQGQLEVCDLNLCDFLECDIKEYNNCNEFIKDSLEEPSLNLTLTLTLNLKMTKNNMEKGVILELYDKSKKTNLHKYLYDFENISDIEKWEEIELNSIMNNDNIDYVCTTYWYLKKYSCVLVSRDIERFNIIKEQIKLFWDDVLKYREKGYEELIKKKYSFKNQSDYNPPNLTFLPDRD